MHYILQNGKPILESDLVKWVRWFETANRRVAFTRVGDAEISTVFLSIDYRFFTDQRFSTDPGSLPILWETFVFGGPLDGERERYTSLDDALHGHEVLAARVLAAQHS